MGTGIRVAVCGGRAFADEARIAAALNAVRGLYGEFACLIHGGATGADTLAAQWANRRGITVIHYPAKWEQHGRAAGPIRNQMMIDHGRPDVLVAFPGGKGTLDMICRAKAARIPVIEIPPRMTPTQEPGGS